MAQQGKFDWAKGLLSGFTSYKGQFSVRTTMYSTLCFLTSWAFVYVVLKYPDQILGYLGVWSSIMLGHDFAKEYAKRKLTSDKE